LTNMGSRHCLEKLFIMVACMQALHSGGVVMGCRINTNLSTSSTSLSHLRNIIQLLFPLTLLHITSRTETRSAKIARIHNYRSYEPTNLQLQNNYRPSMPMPRPTLGVLRILLGCSVSVRLVNVFISFTPWGLTDETQIWQIDGLAYVVVGKYTVLVEWLRQECYNCITEPIVKHFCGW
jgi:hypothetical protein